MSMMRIAISVRYMSALAHMPDADKLSMLLVTIRIM
jgi:hypothetical protein